MTAPSNPTPPKVTWGSEARTAASLLLFAHLFAVIVAVTTYTRPSFLQQRLHEVFDPYLRNLHLTAYPVSYPFARYHLTHALPIDVDFSCQVQFQDAAGHDQTISIPAAGLQPMVRQRRYQTLANAAGSMSDDEANEDAAGILVKAIGGSILKRHGAAQGTFRLRAHYLPEIEDIAGVVPGRGVPPANYRDVYEAQVLVDGDRVDVLKKSTTLEVAPVESGAGESAPRRPTRQQRFTPPKRSE